MVERTPLSPWPAPSGVDASSRFMVNRTARLCTAGRNNSPEIHDPFDHETSSLPLSLAPGNLPDGSFIQCVLRERLCTFERKYRFALVIFCRGGAMPLIARRPPAL